MSNDEQQLREAIDSLRVITDTVKRTQKEALGGSADSFIGLGAILMVGYLGSGVMQGWLVSAWWILLGVSSGVLINLLKSRREMGISKSGRWLQSRYAVVGLGLNVQGWGLTLLSLLYNAYPAQYIPMIWMVIAGVSFITSSLYNHRILTVIGICYIVTGIGAAMLWVGSDLVGVAYLVVGLGSGISLIGLGLYLRRQRWGRITHPQVVAALPQGEAAR